MQHKLTLMSLNPTISPSIIDNPTKHPDSFDRSSLTCFPKRSSFELQCKKEIKHFFLTLRRILCKSTSTLNLAWKGIVTASLNSLRQGQKAYNYRCSLAPNNKNSISSPAIIVRQSLRMAHFLILILTARASLLKNGDVMFDLELVSVQSKIVYKKVNLKKWQQVHGEIEKIRVVNGRMVLMVEDKVQAVELIGKNMEFQSMVQRFLDAEDVKVKDLQTMMDENGWRDNSMRAEVVLQSLERYKYVKRLIRRMVKGEGEENEVNFQQMLAETILYNIAYSLELRAGQSVQKALDTQRTTILKILTKEYERDANRINSSRKNNLHYPHQLDNAQNCWRCKLKRCYVSCSTCNQRQRKPIALCLNCYETHHIDLFGQQSAETQISSLQHWIEIDQQVQVLMRWETNPNPNTKLEK